MSGFDPLKDVQGVVNWTRLTWKLKRKFEASRARARVLEEYGPEVADAVEAAVANGRDPSGILERARRNRQEAEERQRLLASPPPIHGSASWATAHELRPFLKGREAFDTPGSLLLGAFLEKGREDPLGYVHWNDDGHLLTVAPTRSGKAVTTIIPNLLRYRGSAIVIDPKGELYAATSKWRAENVGPVYRIAPFDAGDNPATAGWPRHGYNPLTRIRSQADARSLAELMFPRERGAAEFFSKDAVAFITAVILYVIDQFPAERRTLASVRSIASLPVAELRAFVSQRMAASPLQAVKEAAGNVLGKSGDRGLPNLRDTLHSELALWSDENILSTIRRHDFDFEGLKDRPATVYLELPFDQMKPYAPFLKVVLKSALDAMLRNPKAPEIPVLFVLDEFLALGPFPEFRDAIRTHAGAGVRLWFFLQDVASLEEHYPGATWRPFLNCSVKQFFGVDDPFTGELVGRYLGTATLAYRSTSGGTNTSAQLGDWMEAGSANTSTSSSESIQFAGRPLLTPDEVMALLSAWQPKGWRYGIVHMRGPRPFRVCLIPFNRSETCAARVGAHAPPLLGKPAP